MSEIKTPPKRLVDLRPKWVRIHGRPAEDEGQYLDFDCPCGATAPECVWGGRVLIAIANPLSGPPTAPGEAWHSGATLWQRTGDTFEALTLSPSLNLVGHWHGWLRNGVLESC